MSKYTRLSNVDSVRQINVLEVKSIRGDGTSEDPVEQIIEYFLPDGTRLARVNTSDKPLDVHKWNNSDEENIS